MGRVAIEIGIVFVVYLIGYKMGFAACFDYLSAKLDEKKTQEKEKK